MTIASLGCGSNGASTTGSASAAASGSTAPLAASSAPAVTPPRTERATFAIRRMADDYPVVSRALQNLPVGGSLFDEGAPVGLRRMEVPPEMIEKICGGGLACERDGKKAYFQQPIQELRTFIRIVAQDKETPEAAIDRLRAYLGGFAPPDKGIEYAFGRLVELDSETKQLHVVGARSYAVVGPSPLGAEDITSVTLNEDTATVVIVFSEAAAGRFEKFTGENVYRRIALIVDGNVVSAPTLGGPIPGGTLSIAFGSPDPGDGTSKITSTDKEQAKELASALNAPPRGLSPK